MGQGGRILHPCTCTWEEPICPRPRRHGHQGCDRDRPRRGAGPVLLCAAMLVLLGGATMPEPTRTTASKDDAEVKVVFDLPPDWTPPPGLATELLDLVLAAAGQRGHRGDRAA